MKHLDLFSVNFVQLIFTSGKIMKNITIYINLIYTSAFGIILTFAPDEFLHYIKAHNSNVVIFLQFLGAFFLSYSIMNWTSKDSILGGIYGKAIMMANTVFYISSSFALYKIAGNSTFFICLALLHTFLGISYYLLMSSNPLKKSNANDITQ